MEAYPSTHGHDALERAVLPSRPAEALEPVIAPEMMHKEEEELQRTVSAHA